MAKRPGVSATLHIIAVKDQHCLLYIKHKSIATLIYVICFCKLVIRTFSIIATHLDNFNSRIETPKITIIQMEIAIVILPVNHLEDSEIII
jgi:hypothetical protein